MNVEKISSLHDDALVPKATGHLGEYKNYPTLEEVMMEHGYMLADKGKIKYGVADTVRKKSKKRA